MEEKLYFKPESYGRSKKKGRCKPKNKIKEKKNHKTIKLFCLLLVLVIIITIIILLLRGRTTISGQYPENIKNESLTCISSEYSPVKMSFAGFRKKESKINAVFKGTNEIKSLSFVYTLEYQNSDEAYGAEAKGHALFNKSLGGSGYSVTKFNNKFARYDERLIISLFTNKDDIDEFSAPYFGIIIDDKEKIPKSLQEYRENYEKQNFACETTMDNQ